MKALVARMAFLMCVPVGSLAAQASVAPGTSNAAGRNLPVEKVTGIGGFFLRSADPKALAAWYEKHLGVTQTPTTYEQEPWSQQAGMTIFGPFKADTKYFGDMSKQWMINFRVRNLDAMVEQLKRAGIAVEVDSQMYPNGRFAKLSDPEGNGIQLWEAKRPGG